jgi:hypothetical protein
LPNTHRARADYLLRNVGNGHFRTEMADHPARGFGQNNCKFEFRIDRSLHNPILASIVGLMRYYRVKAIDHDIEEQRISLKIPPLEFSESNITRRCYLRLFPIGYGPEMGFGPFCAVSAKLREFNLNFCELKLSA